MGGFLRHAFEWLTFSNYRMKISPEEWKNVQISKMLAVCGLGANLIIMVLAILLGLHAIFFLLLCCGLMYASSIYIGGYVYIDLGQAVYLLTMNMGVLGVDLLLGGRSGIHLFYLALLCAYFFIFQQRKIRLFSIVNPCG